MTNRLASAKVIAKYLLHGFAFSLASIGVLYVFVFIAMAGILLGGLIGLGLAFIPVFFLYGVLNALLMTILWAPVEWRWSSLLVQGIAIFVVSIPLGLLALIALGIIPLLDVRGMETTLAVLLFDFLFWPLEGYAFVWVGMHWARSGFRRTAARTATAAAPEVVAMAPENPEGLQCPGCGSTSLIVAKDRSAFCLKCGRGIRKEDFSQPSIQG